MTILTQEILERYTSATLSNHRASQGYVYLIHAEGTDRYKIGRSVNPSDYTDLFIALNSAIKGFVCSTYSSSEG